VKSLNSFSAGLAVVRQSPGLCCGHSLPTGRPGRSIHPYQKNDLCRIVPSGCSGARWDSGMVKADVANAEGQSGGNLTSPVFVPRGVLGLAIRGSGFTPEIRSSDSRFRLAYARTDWRGHQCYRGKWSFDDALRRISLHPKARYYGQTRRCKERIFVFNQALPAILPEELRNPIGCRRKILRAAAHRARRKLMENYNNKDCNRRDPLTHDCKRFRRRFNGVGVLAGRLEPAS